MSNTDTLDPTSIPPPNESSSPFCRKPSGWCGAGNRRAGNTSLLRRRPPPALRPVHRHLSADAHPSLTADHRATTGRVDLTRHPSTSTTMNSSATITTNNDHDEFFAHPQRTDRLFPIREVLIPAGNIVDRRAFGVVGRRGRYEPSRTETRRTPRKPLVPAHPSPQVTASDSCWDGMIEIENAGRDNAGSDRCAHPTRIITGMHSAVTSPAAHWPPGR